MHTKSIIAGLSVVALSLLPSCPAPPVAALVLTGLALPLAGHLVFIGVHDNVKRDEGDGEVLVKRQSWPGVPDYNIKMCHDANIGRAVTVTQTSPSSMRIENVAPECMNLAAVFTEQGTPIPCGSACLDYVNLSAADNQKLKDIINKLL
ncbi:hypothetical protein N7465_001236 [Penicillium sp. CMV-2018d]|nr:hypothetical protein N7465_001236 [Penicillium sp. CMV-2018d]